MLFDSGLVDQVEHNEALKTKQEKLDRHGFVHWRRQKAQEKVGALKTRVESGVLSYRIREANWIDEKHLEPLKGRWFRNKDEIRFFGIEETIADSVIKRMINCLDCGFCAVQCFRCRVFNRAEKRLTVRGCTQCGGCLNLNHCMGWRQGTSGNGLSKRPRFYFGLNREYQDG